MKRRFFLFFGLVLLSCSVLSQEVNFKIGQKAWTEDFQFLKKQVEKTVPMNRLPERKKAFEEVFQELGASNFQGSKGAVVFSLQRLLNTLNDEGCNVPLFQKGVALGLLPIKTYWFDDGLFILDAAVPYKELIGQQVMGINGTSVEEVFQRLKPYINADNDHYKKHLFQAYAFMPSILQMADLGTSDDEITLQFASGGTKRIKSGTISDYAQLSRGLPNDEVFDYTDKNHKDENYWLEPIPNTKTLFVQLQRIANNDKGRSFSAFVDDLESYIKEGKTDKIILDLRYGGGGNGFKLKRLTDLLRTATGINKKGQLFVLTSRATRGTLLELASILRQNTKALVIGQPTAEGANTVGDIKYVTLPNSGIKVSLTHTLWPTSWKSNTNSSIFPDVEITFNHTDITTENDPWITLAMDYEVKGIKESIPKELIQQLEGTYNIEGRKVAFKNNNGRLFLTVNRKMKSFFEIHLELYFQSEGVLSTDMEGVIITYNTNAINQATLESLIWKDLKLKIQ